MARGRLDGKVVAITGAGRGIGRAEALLFAEQGAKVVVNDLGGGPTGGGQDRSIAESVVEEIRAAGGEAVAESSSIDSMDGGQALIDKALSAFGRIDILSNNAGIIRPARIDRMTEDDFDRVVAVNLKGYFSTIRAAAPHFVEQRSGLIINKSSPSGFGHYGLSNYTAAKEGVVGLTRTVARDLGQFGVRANAIRPFTYESAMATPEIIELYEEASQLGQTSLWNRPYAQPAGVMPMSKHVAALTVWLSTDATEEVNGREFYIAGSEVGIIAEPEMHRVCFDPDGWSLEGFDRDFTGQYLLGEVRNRYRPQGQG